MRSLDWLVARPIAHRGLHDQSLGVVENTPSAVARAIDLGFAIEIDVRPTADGAAVVFHDETLERLTDASGPVAARPLAELRRIAFRTGADRIWTLEDCLDLVAGRQALVVEIKSSRAADMAFVAGVAKTLAERGGPVAAKSFDPRVLGVLRRVAPEVPRGIIGEAYADDDPHWAQLTRGQRFAGRNMAHWPWTRPDFVSWRVRDLPRRAVAVARRLGLPVMTWTVRTPEEQACAARYADQMVFEGFLPASAAAPVQNR
ncbi:glycerophosphodiester phosphodiesterase family protein [Hansschlegelia sp. KR7-227]|uniref:glycerophosphodiester phosphodiesterase family protein n=1 Tax=Hansschlegelia sp. KR7-227 TaxID=3400914 RepID=UPI003C014766